MNIIYNGGASINVANIIPSDNAISTKTFTVTGNNTTEIEMKYQISLIVEENTFSEEALKYKLISTNTDNNGTVVPSINELTNIGTGAKTIELGRGEFISPTGGDKIHTYNLEIHFPNQDYNQNEDQDKVIKAHIKIENYIPPKLRDVILFQDGGFLAIEAKGNPNFSEIATSVNTGLYSSADEYGTSYYYRGVKNNLKNNLIFGGFQWKIVRINGDGSIRIIYNGTEAQFNTTSTMNTTGINTQISGAHSWSSTTHLGLDAKFVGYMYGGSASGSSTQRNGTTSNSATYNQTSSNAKAQIEAWYQSNILGKPFEHFIVDNIFCNDRQLQSEVGGEATGPGYGASAWAYYAGYYRLRTNKIPTLLCGLVNDQFTISNTKGNGALTYPVGLITADEVAMAGIVWSITNSTNYLYTNQLYWTMTPSYMFGGGALRMPVVKSTGDLGDEIGGNSKTGGLRPVINLSSKIQIEGEGTATNPYRVVD